MHELEEISRRGKSTGTVIMLAGNVASLSESDRDPDMRDVLAQLREHYAGTRLYLVVRLCDTYLERYVGFHLRDCI